MDRSFLSRPEVVKASRDFICIRAMTYESAEEAKILEKLWGHGKLQNTVFTIMSPEAKPLFRGRRTPHELFRSPAQLAQYMYKVSRYYTSKSGSNELPLVDSLRLGLNVAACDHLPVAIVVGSTDSQRKELEAKLAKLSWSDKFIGKLTYVSSTPKEVRKRLGKNYSNGFLFAMPDQFGTTASVVTNLGSSATDGDLERAMQKTITQRPQTSKSHHLHVMEGKRLGVNWQTAIPVTDPHALRARARRPFQR